MSLEKRISSVEQEFGEPIYEIMKGLAVDYSYTFACKVVGLHERDLKEFKVLFKPRLGQGYNPNSRKGLIAFNKSKAIQKEGVTAKDIADKTGLSRNAARNRLKNWPKSRWFEPVNQSGNVDNLGVNRNKEAWEKKIQSDIEKLKSKNEEINNVTN